MMIGDIDSEMRSKGVDGIVVFGDTTLADPDLTYVAGGVLPRGGTYFKKLGKPPLLVVSNLDYGSARRAGKVKQIQTLTQWGYEKLLKRFEDRGDAFPHLISQILRAEGVRGKVVLFGRNDVAKGLQLAEKLGKLGVKIIGQQSPTILETARDRKDSKELEEVRNVGAKTARVVTEVLHALRNAKEKRGHLEIGRKRATVGLIKFTIATKLARENLIAPEGTIFAIGPSAADPHNAGVDSAEIKKGKLMVFDVFPQAPSGYWSDMTRSFVVGRADARARKLFEAVRDAQMASLDYLRVGITGKAAMELSCDIIERAGYRTIREIFQGKTKSLSSGFIHSLGHGVGLTIGESPYLSLASEDSLRSGEIVTVEPGVYLPGYGGVRIEDTVAVRPRGVEILTKVEKELELS
ncbi:MAG: M24 family metallopeptidase [Candidatus Bathyarchaeia archaeon]